MTQREKEIMEEVIKILKEQLGPKKIILFGSRAKMNNARHSDFDFAVETSTPDISLQRKIRERIEAISGLYKVDIVYMDAIDAGFKKIIQETGKVVYAKRT